jgi:glycosyltransferase involved in cell wall biosynthesis
MQDMALISPRAHETKSAPDPIELSIVIPAYNEERAVATTVRRIRSAISKLPMRFEIIVVDDGSADGSSTAANQAGAIVFSLAENRGYCSALKHGIAPGQSEEARSSRSESAS